jgi:hypothetical protein
MLGFEDVPNCDPYPYHPYHPYPKNVQEILGFKHTHRIHGAGIYSNIGGILMVNVTIYSIHGSYGI